MNLSNWYKQSPTHIIIRAVVALILLAVVAYVRRRNFDPQAYIVIALVIVVGTAVNLAAARKNKPEENLT